MRKNKIRPLGKAYDFKNVADSLASEQKYGSAIKNYEKASKYFTKAAKFYVDVPVDKRTDLMEKHIKDFKNLALKTKQRAEELENITGRGPGLFKILLSGQRIRMIIAITSVIMGLYFSSPNLTGNTIANLTNQTTNIIAGVLFIIGIISFYFGIKK